MRYIPSKNSRKPNVVSRSELLLDTLVNHAQPSFTAWHTPEPCLLFANGHKCEDPKTGLALYGPAAINRGARRSIRVGIVGTGDTIQLLKNFFERAKSEIVAGFKPSGQKYDALLSPKFPGFSVDTVFECDISTSLPLTETLTQQMIDRAVSENTYSERVRGVVNLVCERLSVLADREPRPDVVICAMPSIVENRCGVQGRRGANRRVILTTAEKKEKRWVAKSERTGQMLLGYDLEPSDESEQAKQYWDFHNALKARAMGIKSPLPTQLIWESTLREEGGNQDPATVAWNFFTGIYYKAGNVPWELDFPTSGTCFVGVTFYRESPDPTAGTRTSLAQVFTETGEGLVLKGEKVTWDKKRDKKPHLDHEASKELLSRALSLYRKHFQDRQPSRVVVHKTSRFWNEELEGFRAGLENVHSYDFLALERRGIRFLRLGKEPPVRGTVIQLAKRNYLIYTNGYVPFLRAFPGMRVPNPLEVVEHHGDSSAEKVCSEVLALTKLNWNTCSYSNGDPITTAFSRQVGRILTELPAGTAPESRYRFFM